MRRPRVDLRDPTMRLALCGLAVSALLATLVTWLQMPSPPPPPGAEPAQLKGTTHEWE